MPVIFFSHIGLSCQDPIAVEKYYTRYFGFRRARVYDPGPNQVVMIKSGTMYLELFRASMESPVAPAQGAGPDYPGWRHICFQVDNLEAKLAEMGTDAQLTLGPLNMDELIPGMKVCWLADPEGNIIELNQGYVDDEELLPVSIT